jgi:SAM-dependent methyltransferase
MMRDSIMPSRQYYDRLAPDYSDELDERAAYVDGVDSLVVETARESHARTVLDVGCGNGQRLQGVLEATGLIGVGVDESPEMVRAARGLGLDAHRADISSNLDGGELDRRFDLVVALWNVLGHISEREARRRALENMRILTSPGGTIVVDVNNRYNAAEYGRFAVARNVVRDLARARGSGDFVVRRSSPEGSIATRVHIFSEREIVALCRAAGLSKVAVRYIDYRTGEPRGSQWSGQLCVLAKAPRST